MFVLIWVTLLFSVGCSNADTDSFPGGKKHCPIESYCITFSESITAEAGLCVVIPCSFTTRYSFTPQHIVWHKCESSKQRCGDSDIIFQTNKDNKKVQSGFKGRVSLLEPDVSQNNCSIIINDLTESDSGSYQLRVNSVLSDGFTFSQRATVSVKDLTQKPTVMIPPLTEGQQATLTCTAPGLCSGSVPKITWMWRGAGENDSHITGNITASKTEDLTAVTQRHSSTLMFNPSAEHHGSNVTCKVSFTNISTEETVTLNVTYVKEIKITGNTSMKEGDTLNLICSVVSFPPSLITWMKLGLNKNLSSDSGMATLVIPNVTAEYSGQYICTAQHQVATLTTRADVNVIIFPTILSSSACVVQSRVLTCVCISEGFPLPTVKWPLLETHTEYSVTTSASDRTVRISITVSVKDRNYTTVECVSSSEVGKAKKNLIIKTYEGHDLLENLLITFKLPQVIIAFLIGLLLSATICCLARKCHRNKQKSSGDMAETLEMVTTQAFPLIDAGQAVENDGTYDQEATEGGAEAAGQLAPDGKVEPREVEYSNIDFSLLKRKSSTGAEDTRQTTETEYSEIKNKDTEDRTDNGGEDCETLEGNKEKVVMIGEDKEKKQCMSAEEEGGEDVAVYSNLIEIMGEI